MSLILFNKIETFTSMSILQITEEEDKTYKAVIQKKGLKYLREMCRGVFNQWRSIDIKIAVVGEQGSGKSAFINSIRGLSDGDPGSAETGNTETTKKPKKYPFPNREKVEIWDLPGFGSTKFKDKEEYIKYVGFSKFDFILLLSAARFTHNDAWLAEEILKAKPEQSLFFVRTQIDCDILRYTQGKSRCGITKDMITKHVRDLKVNCSRELEAEGIKNYEIFAIDNYNRALFDFDALVRKLVRTVDVIKTEALILSLRGITTGALSYKLIILQNRISTVSKSAGVEGAYTDRIDKTLPAEVEVMFEEAQFYREQLGLEQLDIENFAKRFGVDPVMLQRNVEMRSAGVVQNLESFAEFYKGYDQFRPEIWHSIPLLGGWLKSKAFQRQCAFTLKAFLDICAKDVHSMHDYIEIMLRVETTV